jgi:hypothetical protein
MSAKVKRTPPKPLDLPGVTGPGVGLPVITELDDKALAYVELDDQLKALKEEHESAKLELTVCLDAHADELGKDAEGVIRYYSGEVCISAEPGKRKIKVTTKTGGDSGEHEQN